MPRRIPMPRTDTVLVGLRGGLDLVSPPVLARPGTVRDGQNFEVIEDFTGGYRRIDGYDQYDGRRVPSATTVTHLRVKLLSSAIAADATNNPALFSSFANKGLTQQDGSSSTPAIYGEMVSAVSRDIPQSDPISIQAGGPGWREVAIGETIFGGSRWRGVHATAPTDDVQLSDVYYQPADGGTPDNLLWRVNNGTWSSQVVRLGQKSFVGPVTTLPSVGDRITWKGNTRTFVIGFCVIHEGVLKVYEDLVQAGTANGSDIVVSLINIEGEFVPFAEREGREPTYLYLLDTVSPVAVGERIGVVVGSHVFPARQARELNCLAANRNRTLQAGVPGSGPVRGVFQHGSTVFAFRDDDDASEQKLYKSSSDGWAAVDTGYLLYFDTGNGTRPIPEGTDIAVGTGTAELRRIVTYSGSWPDGDARGVMVLDTPDPVFDGTGRRALSVTDGSNTTTFSIDGNGSAYTLNPGGSWHFITENFKGQEETERVYGACPTNHLIEFDGTTLAPIETILTYTGSDGSRDSDSAATDRPTNLVEFHNHLIFSKGSSIFVSGPGEPYRWSAADGGVEIAMGHDIQGMAVQSGLDAGASLGVFTSKRIIMLNGTNTLNFQTSLVQANLGAIHGTVQQLERTYFMNNLGLFDLESAFRYSKYQQASHSYPIWPFLRDRLTGVVGSVVNRFKNQYRLFFDDGTAIYGTFVNGKPAGYMVQRFPRKFSCVWNGVNGDNEEATYVGDTEDGKVYQFDKGNTFNGTPIDAVLKLHWDTAKMPRTLKTYRRATLFLDGHGYLEYRFGYRLAYEKSDELQQELPEERVGDIADVSHWDTFVWDKDRWDGGNVEPAEVAISGSGESISFVIEADSDCSSSFDVKSISYDYTARRKLRG